VHNLHIDHVMIRSELRYLIVPQVAGTGIWNHGLGTTRPNNGGFMSSPGNNSAKTERVGFLDGSRTKPNHLSNPDPDH